MAAVLFPTDAADLGPHVFVHRVLLQIATDYNELPVSLTYFIEANFLGQPETALLLAQDTRVLRHRLPRAPL